LSRGADGVYRFSNSELKTWMRCPRKWWLSYGRMLAPTAAKTTGPLAIGNRVHEALATYYAGEWDREAALATYKATAQSDVDTTLETDPFADTKKLMSELELGQIMLEGYFDWVEETGADEMLEIIAPETAIEAPLNIAGDQVHLRGKLDVRVRRKFDDARMFMDHKTCASLDQFNQSAQMETQFLTYQLLERLEAWAIGGDDGERADGGIYNLLRKVKRTAQAKPPFYDRIEVRHNDVELRNYYVRVHGVVRQVLNAERALNDGVAHQYVVPPNPTRDCQWDCPFKVVCPMFDDGSRAEDFVNAYYVTIDPDARYMTEEAKKDNPS
jgi:hypothetical protein